MIGFVKPFKGELPVEREPGSDSDKRRELYCTTMSVFCSPTMPKIFAVEGLRTSGVVNGRDPAELYCEGAGEYAKPRVARKLVSVISKRGRDIITRH